MTCEEICILNDDDVRESEVPNVQTRTYEYVTCEEALKNLELSSEKHLNEKKFLDYNDHRTFDFDDEFSEEVSFFFPHVYLKYKRFRGRKDKSFAAWLILKDFVGEPFRINASFLEKALAPKVTAVTLLNSNEVRQLRVSKKEDGSRLYEIINESCKIRFDWMVEDGRRELTAVLKSDGRVNVVESKCKLKDLAENRDAFVRLGKSSNPELSLKDVFSKCHEKTQFAEHGQ